MYNEGWGLGRDNGIFDKFLFEEDFIFFIGRMMWGLGFILCIGFFIF